MPDYFGYLPYSSEILFEGGKVSPRPDFADVVSWVNEHANIDGFLYPPTERQLGGYGFSDDEWQEVPNSRRPAHLHRIPPTHELYLDDSNGAFDASPRNSGSFIIHVLGYLFGVRLQFCDWWFDGRVPIRSTHQAHPRKRTVDKFLSHCYRAWKSWALEDKKLITNILFMHSRATLYEWDWERFSIEYMVVDGCWRLAAHIHNLPTCSHGERINCLCQKFGIPVKDLLVKDIIALRNDLFHETLWDKSQPCTASPGPGYSASLNIRKLNQRLIPAVLGYETEYVKTPWWIMGNFHFE